MAKKRSKISRHPKNTTVKAGARQAAQNTKMGRFVLGRDAFSKVSAVEGIRPSKRLMSDLGKLQGASSKVRRGVLAEKYGKG